MDREIVRQHVLFIFRACLFMFCLSVAGCSTTPPSITVTKAGLSEFKVSAVEESLELQHTEFSGFTLDGKHITFTFVGHYLGEAQRYQVRQLKESRTRGSTECMKDNIGAGVLFGPIALSIYCNGKGSKEVESERIINSTEKLNVTILKDFAAVRPYSHPIMMMVTNRSRDERVLHWLKPSEDGSYQHDITKDIFAFERRPDTIDIQILDEQSGLGFDFVVDQQSIAKFGIEKLSWRVQEEGLESIVSERSQIIANEIARGNLEKAGNLIDELASVTGKDHPSIIHGASALVAAEGARKERVRAEQEIEQRRAEIAQARTEAQAAREREKTGRTLAVGIGAIVGIAAGKSAGGDIDPNLMSGLMDDLAHLANSSDNGDMAFANALNATAEADLRARSVAAESYRRAMARYENEPLTSGSLQQVSRQVRNPGEQKQSYRARELKSSSKNNRQAEIREEIQARKLQRAAEARKSSNYTAMEREREVRDRNLAMFGTEGRRPSELSAFRSGGEISEGAVPSWDDNYLSACNYWCEKIPLAPHDNRQSATQACRRGCEIVKIYMRGLSSTNRLNCKAADQNVAADCENGGYSRGYCAAALAIYKDNEPCNPSESDFFKRI